jgi:hypothetical protein
MSAMKASRWSLGETNLVVIVVWLATVFAGALAWNHRWRPWGMDVPELVLIVLLVFWFISSARKRGGDE